MTFISLSFIIFLSLTVLCFYICPVKHRWVVLLLSSIVFYAANGPEYLPFIFVTTLTVYLAGVAIGKVWEKQKADLGAEGLSREDKKDIKEKMKKKRKKIMLIVLIFNLGILCAVKFAKFFLSPVNSLIGLFGSDFTLTAKSIIVPLGVSYYTFSVVSYLLDVYWNRFEYEKNFGRFALYAIYFPHILQGPIENYARLGAELKKELRFDAKRVLFGLQLMLWGYFKKLVISDRLNIFVKDIFGSPGDDLGVYYLIAAVFDVIMIYTDFSGCMDIARGISQIFGVKLDLNFDHPFFAVSIPEFWRRWHITLGEWFKSYVYYPVSTSSLVKKINKKVSKAEIVPSLKKLAITGLPIVVTWLLTGIWHGTGSTYVAWGVYYSALILLSTCLHEPYQAFLTKKLHIRTDTASWRILQSVKVFLLFMGGRLLTAPGGLKNTVKVVMSMLFKGNFYVLTDGSLWKTSPLDVSQFLVAGVAVMLLFAVSWLQYSSETSLRERISKENLFTGLILTVGLAVFIAVFGVYGPSYSASSFAYMVY